MLYLQSTRNGQTCYTSYQGTPLEVAASLMTDLGHTDIEQITKEDFDSAVALEQSKVQR